MNPLQPWYPPKKAWIIVHYRDGQMYQILDVFDDWNKAAVQQIVYVECDDQPYEEYRIEEMEIK